MCVQLREELRYLRIQISQSLGIIERSPLPSLRRSSSWPGFCGYTSSGDSIHFFAVVI
jgi:hypothetical protein